MTLVIHELGLTGAHNDGRVRQLVTVGDEPLDVYAIRPHIFKWLAPAGSLYVRVTDTNGKKVADSETIAISAIHSGSNYPHGKYRFLLSCHLRRQTQYYFELCSTGYTYGAAAFVAWANDWEMRNIHSAAYATGEGISAPLAFELWTYQQIEKGVYPL